MTSPHLLPGSAHFHVIEEPAYAPSGSGEHLYVEIEKEGLTTDEVATTLARTFGVKAMNVGFAGRKDRHAITRQWFSILGGREADATNIPKTFSKGRLAVFTVARHGNKIRVGHLAGNRFRLGLGGVSDIGALQTAFARLAATGLINRFGAQRFGFGGVNLRIAAAWGAGHLDEALALVVDPSGNWHAGEPLPSRFRLGPEGKVIAALKHGAKPEQALSRAEDLRKLIASAAQAAIFNAILDARVSAGLSHRLRVGDLACTRDGASFLVDVARLDEVNARAAPGVLDAIATAPMPGVWRLTPSLEVLAEERAWSANTGIDWAWFGIKAAFESPGGRRPLVVPFKDHPRVEQIDGVTWVTFTLPSGAFATEALQQAGVTLPTDRSVQRPPTSSG
ncbi:MAG: tRNA pseudouridine(13) synthase TruD [Planctomycetota bacterium]